MNLKSLALSLLVASGLTAASHHADATTYKISGTFGDGGLLTGSLDFDDGTLSNVDLTTTGSMGAHYADGYYVSDDDPMMGGFQGFYFNSGGYYLNILDISVNPDFPSISWHVDEYINGTQSYRTGAASFASAAVVPLPAALPLAASAFAGLGGLGWLNRRRGPAGMTAAA